VSERGNPSLSWGNNIHIHGNKVCNQNNPSLHSQDKIKSVNFIILN